MIRFSGRIFCLIVSCLVSFCASDDNGTCKKIDLCECSFSNGLTINLTPLRSRVTSFASALPDVIVYFHPCADVPLGNTPGSECASGAALCMYNKTKSTYSILGKSADATFSTEGGLQNVFLKYSYQGKNSAIQLVCESIESEGSAFVINAVNASHVALVLKSPWACLRPSQGVDADTATGMSTGSLLVLLFFVFSLVYAGGGALALKFLRGASGKEMIPNYDFWVDLPFLCRDGLLFLLSGCKPLPAYDRI